MRDRLRFDFHKDVEELPKQILNRRFVFLGHGFRNISKQTIVKKGPLEIFPKELYRVKKVFRK